MLSQQVMIDKTNEAISELVYNKFELQKAYNYYAGKRDPDQYRYLEENYGIGNPTSVEFTPLIKKHIDALIGEFLGAPIIPKVSCKDSDTISNISIIQTTGVVSIEVRKAKYTNRMVNGIAGKKYIIFFIVFTSLLFSS